MTQQEVVAYFKHQFTTSAGGLTVGLIGSLGAGKTDLVKTLFVRFFGGNEQEVQSPTYNLCNVYSVQGKIIHHIDLYRLSDETELVEIGLEESISETPLWTFIEWVDRFPVLLTYCDLLVTIEVRGDQTRDYWIESKIRSTTERER